MAPRRGQAFRDIQGVGKASGQARFQRNEGVDVAAAVGDDLAHFDQPARAAALSPVRNAVSVGPRARAASARRASSASTVEAGD